MKLPQYPQRKQILQINEKESRPHNLYLPLSEMNLRRLLWNYLLRWLCWLYLYWETDNETKLEQMFCMDVPENMFRLTCPDDKISMRSPEFLLNTCYYSYLTLKDWKKSWKWSSLFRFQVSFLLLITNIIIQRS